MSIIKERLTKYRVSSFIALFSGMLFLWSGPVLADEKDEMIETANKEVEIAQRFLSNYPNEEYSGKLVTLYKDSLKIR